MLRDRRNRVMGVWRWSPRVDEAVVGTRPHRLWRRHPLHRRHDRPLPPDRQPSRPLPVTAVTGPAPPPEVLAVAVGPRLLYRRLTYAAPAGQLTDFDTQLPTLGLGLRVDWFPLPGAFRRLGVVGQLEQTRQSDRRPGGELVSPSRDLGAAAQWRLPRPRLELGLNLGVGLHRFDFQAQEITRRLPDRFPTSRSHVQAGLELRARAAGRLAMVASSHYRHVVHAGGVTSRDWFPGARIRGLDASAASNAAWATRSPRRSGWTPALPPAFRRSTSTRLTSGARDDYYPDGLEWVSGRVPPGDDRGTTTHRRAAAGSGGAAVSALPALPTPTRALERTRTPTGNIPVVWNRTPFPCWSSPCPSCRTWRQRRCWPTCAPAPPAGAAAATTAHRSC